MSDPSDIVDKNQNGEDDMDESTSTAVEDAVPNVQDEMDESAKVIEDPCPVCLSRRTEESGVDGCSHTFCFSCIVEWLKVSESCPLCKAPVSEVRTSKIVDGKPMVKKMSELKAEAEAARIMAQAMEVPMTSEREAVTQCIHQQRAAVQKLLSDKSRDKHNRRMNELYKKETSRLNQLQALRDEMDRLPRRDIMGHPLFREVVYTHQLVWKAISRPTTAIRFNCAVACAQPDVLMQRLKPFLTRELKVVMESKRHISDTVMTMILTDIQNHEINNPSFEVVMLNRGFFRPWCIGIFCGLLYEFCASGLELDAFDANSTYSLDQSRAPSGRLIPNLLPVSSRTNEPIFLDVDDDEADDDAIIIDRHRSDTSSSDGVADLYDHNACRMRPSDNRSSRHAVHGRGSADMRNLHERLSTIMPGLPFPSMTFPGFGRIQSFGRSSSKRTPELISIEDESAPANQARINSIPRRDLDTSMGDPSWLNVTGEGSPSTSRSAFGSRLNPIQSPSIQNGDGMDRMDRGEGRQGGDRRGDRDIETSWRTERDRRNESRREKKKFDNNRIVMGMRIGSRKNTASYYYDKLSEEKLSLDDLERLNRDLSSFLNRISSLKEDCRSRIAAKKEAKGSNGLSKDQTGVIEVDDDIIDVHEDEAGPSRTQDDSILIVS